MDFRRRFPTETQRKPSRFFSSLCLCDSVVEKGYPDHSPYGTQIFFTWVACCRNHRPSPCFTSNQSMARPSLVKTCFKFPVENDLAAKALASSVKHQRASTSSCSARTLSSCAEYPVTMLTTPPGRSLVSQSWYKSPVMSG